MKKLLLVLYLLFGVSLRADISPFEQTILDRNGDVYVLVTSATGNDLDGQGLYKFTRADEYAISKIGNAALMSNIKHYSGLSVDKFGHISLFRDKGDGAAVGLLAELRAGRPVAVHPGSPAAWPGLEDVCWDDSGGVPTANCPSSKTGGHWRKATPPGWAYVVEPNGKYGWYKMYDWDRVGLRGSSSCQGYQYKSPATFPAGTEIIPQALDTGINTCNGWYSRHGDSWWNAPTNKASYAFGLNGGGTFHPPINSFWSGANVHRGGRRIAEVEKSVTALYLDKYLTAADNKELYDARSDAKFSLTNNVDYFNSGVGDYFNVATSALNTSLSFAQEIKAYNHCYDMCGQGAFDVPQAPIVINEGRAKFSSGGNSALNQRSYMIKTASRDQGSRVETSVVQLNYNPATNSFAQSDVVVWEGTFRVPSGNPAPKYSTATDIDASSGSNIVVYKFPGYPGEFSRSVQTSRRVKGSDETKDYVYISNAPFSHFNVSESFWGTGGVVWWAKEIAGRKLELHFEQRNHQATGNPLIINSGTNPIVADGVEALQAIGADGDNFIYILHAGKGSDGRGGAENADDMTRLLTPITKGRIEALAAMGKMVSPPTFPIACAPPADPCEVSVVLKISSGLVLEKIAPLAGSKPVRIGVVPLEETGKTCQAIVVFPDPTGLTPGAYGIEFECEVTSAAAVVENFNIEMSVINVANPPATGGDSQLDIVAIKKDGNVVENGDSGFKSFVEDTTYLFNMENPPNFNGTYAQLGVTDPTRGLADYGLMRMISNYDVTGIDLMKNAMVKGSLLYNKYYNEDARVGRLLASFLNDKQKTLKLLYEGADQTRTLRYRWRVIAKTPPHSLKSYSAPVCNPLLGTTPLSPENTTLLKNLGYLDASGAEPLNTISALGIVYDSCWHDMTEVVAVPGITTAIAPPELSFKFTDPGEYEVWLMTGGMRFNADQLTFLSRPDSVNAQVYVTWYAKKIHVGAKIPEGDNAITDLVIANNHLNTGIELRSGIYTSIADMKKYLTTGTSSDFKDATDVVGEMGRFPVLPSYNYPKSGGQVASPLLVTYEQQRTPIVAEAEIQFFRILDTMYLDFGAGSTIKQAKTSGVGAWDYEYPGGGAMNQIGGYNHGPFVDKTGTHPPNWNSISPDKIITDALTAAQSSANFRRYGYDASGDPETGRGVNGTGTLLAVNFENAHQGTLASCDNFPANGVGIGAGNTDCFIRHPETMYTWWEIKYAWFMRYQRPDGTEVIETIRTGNLAEIFALNLYARYQDNWKHLVRNLAPEHLLSSGISAFDDNSPLIKSLNDGKFRVRIPLMNSGALLDAPDPLSELKAPLRTLNGAASFADLYKQIHPLAFNIPSEPTVIEIGMQIFFPKMDWAGRDKKGDKYAYYDAVYFDDNSGYASNQFTNYSFGMSFNAWPRFAMTRNIHSVGGGVQGDAQALGLKLANATGGFTDGTYTAPGNGVDDFLDIVVLDMTAPSLRVVSGGTLSAVAGGRVGSDILLEVEDNNPYALWNSYNNVGDTGSTNMEVVPSLVHFAYDVGPDPRNQYGIGLKKRPDSASPHNAYGFNLSYTDLETDHSAFRTQSGFDVPQFSRITKARYSGTPNAVQNPGFSYTNATLASATNWFYYPQNRNTFPTDGLFVLRDDDDFTVPATASTLDDYCHTWERFNTVTDLHYYLPAADLTAVKDYTIRVDDGSFYMDGVPYLLLSFVPPNNRAPYNLAPDYTAGERVEFVDDTSYDRFDINCLSASNPFVELLDNCKIKTRWRIPKEHIIAPYFMDGEDQTLELRTYAKARDVRISVDWPKLHGAGVSWEVIPTNWYKGDFGGAWPKYESSTAFVRRVGVENADLDGGVGSAVVNSVSDLVEKVFDNELQRRANTLGTITVEDKSAPNFRVTITEFKNRTQVEYIVMGAQGFDPSSEAEADTVFYFKTPDPRATLGIAENDIFTSAHKLNTGLTELGAQNLEAHVLANEGNSTGQAYLIPEDVRFEIRVQATDNRDFDQRGTTGAGDISITIQGGYDYARPSYSDIPPATKMDGIYIVPATTSAKGRVYQQMKFASVYHHYPRAGFYDVIQIEVTDTSGNMRRLRIPIEVISQNVFFRQVGNDMNRR